MTAQNSIVRGPHAARSKLLCRVFIAATVAAVFVGAAGCGDAGQGAPNKTRQTPADGRADWPDPIRFGLVPTEGGADTRRRFAHLRQQLTASLDARVKLVSASSYQGVITAMANDQIEFAWLGPKSYIEAARRAKAEALLIELNTEGQPGYHGLFIVPANSPIDSIEDAEGADFAFTDPNSTSGFLIPSTVLFDEVGEAAESFFGDVRFSGAHGTSILQVAAGELDIAATNDLDMAKMLDKGAIRRSDVKVIYQSDLIPGSPIAARRDVPESLKTAVVEAMLDLNDHPEVLAELQNGGYARVDDAKYDIIRATQRFLENQRARAETNDPAGVERADP